MGEIKLPTIKLPSGHIIPYIPFDLDCLRIVRMELIIGWHNKLKLYGDGDFADGHKMLKQREEEEAEWEREERERKEKGYS